MNYYIDIKQEFLKNNQYKKIKEYSKNKNDLETYFNVGKLLIEAQGGEGRAKYGNELVKEYSKKLTDELGSGYSTRNLKNMRKFYLMFSKGQAMTAQLTWSHYCELLPIKEETKRNYYINISIKECLTYRELRNRIKLNEYERLEFIDKNNIILYEEPNNIKELIKNPILIKNNDSKLISEYTLKQLILEDIPFFLHELGSDFSFIDSEYKIKIGNRYNYIDILLYNIKFNCYVVIELKVTEFKAEYIGQVKKYMNYIDQNMKTNNQDNTIGIIICKRENEFIMEYISDDKIFTTAYELINI